MITHGSTTAFVYGTLMAPQVLKVLIGRVPDLLESATLSNYCRYPVKGQVFPGMIPCSSNNSNDNIQWIAPTSTTGMLLQGLSDDELRVLDWFEGDEYVREHVQVTCNGISYDTQCYIWSNPTSELDLTKEWDYTTFLETKLDWYLTSTVRPCRVQLDQLGIGQYDITLD